MLRIISLLVISLFCIANLHAEQTTSFGYHLHSWPETGFSRFSQMMNVLKKAGGTVARNDTNWQNFQLKPKIAFNPNASKLKPTQYLLYLNDRGYGENGSNLYEAYNDLHNAHLLGLKSVFNFGVIPEWARQPASNFTTWKSGTHHEFTFRPTPLQVARLTESSLANPDNVGQFLADLIVYISKQPDGKATLQSMGGWEIFNEITNIYGNGAPPPKGSANPEDAWPLLPPEQYLATTEGALYHVHNAYKSIGIQGGPPVIAPNIGGMYDNDMWQAIADYHPTHATLKNPSGHLALDQIGLHPYGMNVFAWREPQTFYNAVLEDGPNDVRNNISYGRELMPTDDRFTWATLIERAKSTPFADRAFPYRSHNNNADEYFDLNTEIGVERTMARFAQLGYGKINVNFSEWGASSYIGDTSRSDFFAQLNTTFADPFKYGKVSLGTTLPNEMSENTQTEAIVQTLGLMRNWDFVNTATVYEMFEKPLPTPTDSPEYQFGLAAPRLKPDGSPNWKPAGLVYNAFLRGQEIHQLHPHGVDIHISAKEGTFDDTQLGPDAHNLILFNDNSPHSIATGAGDDIIFGGAADDFISGGQGHNRLYGGFGNDIIVGGSDNDKICGGSGDDLLSGGGGKNEFVFSAYSTSGSGFDGHDTITDYKPTDVLTIIGAYRAEDLLANPKLMQDTKEGGIAGVKIFYADNDASIFLQNYSKARLTAANFHIFEPLPQALAKQ